MAQWETLKDAYSITKIDENIDSLSGADWSASLDLNMAYYQAPMSESDKI